MTNSPDDLTDAQRDDAADLLDVVAKNRNATRNVIRPGVTELFVLFAAWCCGRLPSIGREDSSFVRTVLVIGAVVMVIEAALWLRRRANLGAEVVDRTWFYAGFVFTWSVLMGLDLHGDARQWTLVGGFVVACAVFGAMLRSAILLLAAAAMLIASATQIWPLVVATPIYLGCMALGYSFQEKVMGHKK